MSITLAYDGTTLDLTERLLWTDEYDWSPVVTESRWGTTGALHLHVGKRKAGRPITLDGVTSNACINRALCDQLRAWKVLPGAVFTLTVRGVARQVVWLEFSAQPLWRLADGEHQPDTVYRPSYKFLEV